MEATQLQLIFGIITATLSILALVISIINIKQAQILASRSIPYFALEEFKHCPDDFIAYATKGYVSDNSESPYKVIPEDLRKMILEHKNELSRMNYEGQKYLLINLLPEDAKAGMLEHMKVYMGILTLKYVNRNQGDALKLRITNACSTLQDGKKIKLKVNPFSVPIMRDSKDNQIILTKIIYVHSERQTRSILTNRFLEAKDKIDFLEDYNKAKAMLNFKDTAFEVNVRVSPTETATSTMHITMDDNGDLDQSIKHGRIDE